MRTRTFSAGLGALAVGAALAAAAAASAGALDGTVKLGGTIVSQTGDRSAVQETYNVYDGFSLTQLRLAGLVTPRHYVDLDLEALNLGARRGDLVYRSPGLVKLTAGFDQHRQVFSPDGAVDARRKDWRVGLEVTPARSVLFSGSYAELRRDGDRLPYPAGTLSALGSRYDNRLRTGQVAAEVHEGRRGGAVALRFSSYDDALAPAAHRTGTVLSGRLYAPMPFYDKWTNVARGAVGLRRLPGSGLETRLADLQYTGVAQPVRPLEVRYQFEAERVDDPATQLTTDRFVNEVGASYDYRYGRVRAGYGYETNDDDHTLTSYHGWSAGTDFRYGRRVRAGVDYAGRTKKDEEQLTLLQDVEASRVRARLEAEPARDLAVGGDYARREREFTDIGVEADGDLVDAFARYTRERWGSISADFSYSTDDYRDPTSRFRTLSRVATGRAELTRVRNLRLAGGLTWLRIGRSLDIEKSMVFAEGSYTVLRSYRLEVKYNVYNYDDYVLLDRYYTANVVQINLAYDFRLR